MWLRAVHSFLISAALTEASPIWASVSGYYSSHYTVRGLAHLLGYFQLFRRKMIVQLRLEDGRYICSYKSKKKCGWGTSAILEIGEAELLLWRRWPFYRKQSPNRTPPNSRHRNHANYADHLAGYPRFRPLNAETLQERIEYISKIALDAAPLPRTSKFPDLEFVQLIAYHRIVKFRRTVDEVLGGKNKFWKVHRNPSFAGDYMDFQLAEGAGVSQPGSDR